MIAIVVTICFGLSSCHEEVVARQVMPMCFLSPSAVALWKEQSRFSGPQWTLGSIRCEAGDYRPKDAI
jgi:hypothetical protein